MKQIHGLVSVYARRCLLVLMVIIWSPGLMDKAQAAPTCDQFAARLPDLISTCKDAKPGQACAANAEVVISDAGQSQLSPLDPSAPARQIKTLQIIQGSSLDLARGAWGIAVIRPRLRSLPGGALLDHSLSLVLLGNSQLNLGNASLQDQSPTITCSATVRTSVGLLTNPDPQSGTVGFVSPNDNLIALARSSDSLNVWVSVKGKNGLLTGWIAAARVQATCDLTALPETGTEPLSAELSQTLVLSTAPDAPGLCRGLPRNSLFIQSPVGVDTTVTLNGVQLTLNGASASITAVPNRSLTVSLIDGSASVSARDRRVDLTPRTQVSIALGGPTRLSPLRPPGNVDFAPADETGRNQTLCRLAQGLGSGAPCAATGGVTTGNAGQNPPTAQPGSNGGNGGPVP